MAVNGELEELEWAAVRAQILIAADRGGLQNATGAVTVVADRLAGIDLATGSRSRDF
ncbi:MAG: hypothetical protein V3W34_05945 [Phycisphaerae bacterium]